MAKRYSSLNNVDLPGAWLTIGSFDGVHRGHQALITRLVSGAHAAGAPAVVLTFFPHPSIVLRGKQGPYYLNTPEEKAEILAGLGIDGVVTLEFSRELAAKTAAEFMGDLKRAFGLRQLWVGYNFALGRGREGDLSALRQLGDQLNYTVQVIEPIDVNGEAISSSLIRTLIKEGHVEQAAEGLGRPYSVTGEVTHGDGRGKGLGIPTANLSIWAERLLPGNGVYACWAEVDGERKPAVTNIGVRPTFENGEPTTRVEAHLLDFDRDLYGKTVRLAFEARLRGEERFPSVDALLGQISKDIQNARRLLNYEL